MKSARSSLQEWRSSADRSTVQEAKKKRRVKYNCPICKDMGWLYAESPDAYERRGFGTVKTRRCECRNDRDNAKRQRYLNRVDGLTASERKLGFEKLRREYNGKAIERVEEATDRLSGFITLTGEHGRGKSTLLICAVNAAKEMGVPAVYSTVTDVLDHLRQAYNPEQGELSFDSRWDLLVKAEVLALDEMDEFHTTSWAMERFLRLIDERWRNMAEKLTLFATDAPLAELPSKVRSRLEDSRARVEQMAGPDMRKFMQG